jgi:hypothetical protein
MTRTKSKCARVSLFALYFFPPTFFLLLSAETSSAQRNYPMESLDTIVRKVEAKHQVSLGIAPLPVAEGPNPSEFHAHYKAVNAGVTKYFGFTYKRGLPRYPQPQLTSQSYLLHVGREKNLYPAHAQRLTFFTGLDAFFGYVHEKQRPPVPLYSVGGNNTAVSKAKILSIGVQPHYGMRINILSFLGLSIGGGLEVRYNSILKSSPNFTAVVDDPRLLNVNLAVIDNVGIFYQFGK